MKKLFITTIIVLVSILNIQAQEKIKIAVMDFAVGYGVEKEMVNELSDAFISSLSETDKFTIEKRLHLILYPNVEQLTEICEKHNVKYVLTVFVNYSELYDEYSLYTRVFSVESGKMIYITKIVKDKSKTAKEALHDLMPKLADELTKRSVEDPDELVYQVVDKMPSFPGGDNALNQYLSRNVRYPIIGCDHIQGRVICQFIVKKDGSIVNVVIIRGLDTHLDKEAVRVIDGMPKWNPGMQDGKPVNVFYVLPVSFRLQ